MTSASNLVSESQCGCTTCDLPPGFVRLRYFFGKRMGVADFKDEQLYHLGKQRFHNMYLHGRGLLCGLGVECFGDEGSVLRVGRGAALDACGHEIVVPWDQCIDVDAWYRATLLDRADDPGSTWPDSELDGDRLRLCVSLRYRECKTGAEPAPRDPCGLGDAAGGSDFGRVRESFELELLSAAEAEPFKAELTTPANLAELLDTAEDGAALWQAIGSAITTGCPTRPGDDRLILACFDAVLDVDHEHVEAIENIQATPLLLSTATLQRLIRWLLDRARPSGPTILAGDLLTVGAQRQFVLAVDSPLIATTVDERPLLSLVRLDATGWTPPPSGFELKLAWDQPSQSIVAVIDDPSAGPFLIAGGRYRMSLSRTAELLAAPPVDDRLRALVPGDWAWSFELVDDGGQLIAKPIGGA